MQRIFLNVCAILFISVSLSPAARAYAPDWSYGALVPPEGRENIFQWPEQDFEKYKEQGKLHAQIYPVSVTGILFPYQPIKKMIDEPMTNPFKSWLQKIFRGLSGIKNFEKLLTSIGLHAYPVESDKGIYSVPYPNNSRPSTLMGFGLIERGGAQGFTFSCAACHSSHLFGKTVLGMTNRFPRANEFFVKAKKMMPVTAPSVFKYYTGASSAEAQLFAEAKEHFRSIGVKQPMALGLDTSLAQVSLSLNRRWPDPYARYSEKYALIPRKDDFLDNNPADSKPAVWWNLKYKNRWLSDGSVISGNPLFTNILWNEIGRGVDLRVLEKWLEENKQIIEELTTAVFSMQSPLYTDFFPAENIEVVRAKRGEVIFNDRCAKCHGTYEKVWSTVGSESLPWVEQMKTLKVRYHEDTPIEDVGTDPYRRLGMKSLEQLNNLAISKKNGIVVQAQKGYVPPPLVGIWARWPYFHNNSIPNLCALLTPAAKRPVVYYSGEANDPATDFDKDCNGYPLGQKTPTGWKTSAHLYDTRKKGLGNSGHDDKIFMRNGKELLTAEDKKNLIQFLQTL